MGQWMVDTLFLTLALVGGEWWASCTDHFTPGERVPSTHWIGGWMDPRASLDDVGKRKFLTPLRLELRPLSYPSCSQLLYWLRYPSSCIHKLLEKKWNYNETVHQPFVGFSKAYDSGRREVLYNILIEFGVPMKLVRLIKMCLNETYGNVRIKVNFNWR
jgi:hypothetical protein